MSEVIEMQNCSKTTSNISGKCERGNSGLDKYGQEDYSRDSTSRGPHQSLRMSERRDTMTVLLDTIRCWYNPTRRYKQRWLFGRKVRVGEVS